MKKILLFVSILSASVIYGQADSLFASFNFNACTFKDGVKPQVDAIPLSGINLGTDRNGNTYTAANFGGNGTLNVGSAAKLNVTNGLTISAWINPTGVSGQQAIVSKWAGSMGQDQYILMLSGNKLTFAVGKPTASAAGHTGNISISSNTWTHVVATWDTSGHHCIYVNGVLDIDVVNPSFKQINSVSTTALHIGSMAYSQRFFIGRIDDVKLFNKSLSASQVTDLYAENSIINNLISRFTFDEQNADDVVGGNHALATSASYTTDRFGNASKALNVSSTTFVNFNDAYDHFSTWSAGQVSYSFWINFTAINSAYQIMLGKSADAGCGGNDREFLFRLNPNSKLEITNYSSVTPGNYVVLQGTTTCTSNQWYHVVLTYNNANTGNAKFAIYLNGVQQTLSVANTAGLGMGTGFENGSSPLSVGAYLKSDGTICQNVQRLTAYFDDFEVYNKELSLSEVVAMYNAGNPVGVEDVVVTKDLTVFPNPFTNEITIKNSANMEGKIELIDLEGKILLTSFINEETSIVNTSEINPGMYLLILTNAEGKTVKKVVKY